MSVNLIPQGLELSCGELRAKDAQLLQGLGPICIVHWVPAAQVIHVSMDFIDKFSLDWVCQIHLVVKKHLLALAIESLDLLVECWQNEKESLL